MAYIQKLLVISIGMNRCHQTAFNPEFFQQYFGKGCQAVRGAGCIGNDVVFCRIVLIFIYTHNNGDILIFAGSGNDNLFRAVINMSLSFFRIFEFTGAFQHDVRAIFAPGNLGNIRFAGNRNLFSVNYKKAVFPCNIFLHGPVNGIIFQQMRHYFADRPVVDSYNFYVRKAQDPSQRQTTNTTKTTNTNFYHTKLLLKKII